MTVKPSTKAARRALGILFNPVSLVAFASPIILTLNLIYTRNFAHGSSDELVQLIDDPLFRAILDYRTQLTTVIIAFIFYLVDNARSYRAVMNGKTIEEFWQVIDGKLPRVINLVACGALLLIFLYTFVSGQLSRPEIIDYYVRPAGPLEVGLIPPLESPLTWARGLLILAGFASAIAFSDHD